MTNPEITAAYIIKSLLIFIILSVLLALSCVIPLLAGLLCLSIFVIGLGFVSFVLTGVLGQLGSPFKRRQAEPEYDEEGDEDDESFAEKLERVRRRQEAEDDLNAEEDGLFVG